MEIFKQIGHIRFNDTAIERINKNLWYNKNTQWIRHKEKYKM